MAAQAASPSTLPNNAGGGRPAQLYQGLSKEAFGFKMLQAMGWAEGKGLGAAETGITRHIAAVKRQDQIGIGADSKCDTSAKVDWTVNTHQFDQILAGACTLSTPLRGSAARAAAPAAMRRLRATAALARRR